MNKGITIFTIAILLILNSINHYLIQCNRELISKTIILFEKEKVNDEKTIAILKDHQLIIESLIIKNKKEDK